MFIYLSEKICFENCLDFTSCELTHSNPALNPADGKCAVGCSVKNNFLKKNALAYLNDLLRKTTFQTPYRQLESTLAIDS